MTTELVGGGRPVVKQALERSFAKASSRSGISWLNSAVAVRATLAALPFDG
jgi:hypothetical protein